MDKETRRYLKLQTRLGIYLAVSTVLVVTLSLSALYFDARTRIRQDVRQRLHDIVSIAAQQIDADAHSTLTDPDQENSTTYLQVKHTLQQVRDIGSDLYYVYTMRLDADGRIRFVVDAEENPDEIAHLDEVYDDASDMIEANIVTLDHPIVEEEFYTDKWGTWLTGYAPFYRPDGRREGVLGIDIKADRVKIYERRLLWRGLAVFGATLPLALLFGWLLGRRIASPIVQLTTIATAIAAGDLEQSIPAVRRNDEVGALAQAFGSMAEQLGGLISGLEQRVDERTRDLERRTIQLKTAAEVAREAAAIRDVNQLLDETVRLISERFGFYHAGVFLVDDAREYAVLQAASSEGGRRMLERGHKLAVGKVGMVGYVTGTGEPRIALDVGEDAVHFVNPDLPETRSEMALPLRVHGEAIGVLDVQSTEPDAFSDEDVATLQTMADQLAVAIENARLFEQTQASLREVEALYGDYSKEAWGTLTRAGRLYGYTYDRVSVSPATADQPPEVQQALQERRVVAVGGGDGRDESVLAIPISVRGKTIGVLDIHKSGEAGEWTPEEMSLVERVSDQLGVALESARLYQDTQRRAAREQLTGEVTARMRETLDVETVLKTAADEMYQALGLDEIVIRLATEGMNVSLQ
jgi:GAF domain-containing protein/HAMP domain-containing protein